MQDAKNTHVENVLILAGDHLYRMDYMDLIQVYSVIVLYNGYYFYFSKVFSFTLVTNEQSHVDRNADITVSCAAVGNRCV